MSFHPAEFPHQEGSKYPSDRPRISSDEAWVRHAPPADDLSKGPKSGQGPYEEMICEWTERYPNLIFLCDQLQWQRDEGYSSRGRVSVIEFHDGEHVNDIAFDSPEALRRYLSEPRTCSRRQFVVEDIAADYVEVLGSFLSVNPFLFATHIAMVIWEHSLEHSKGPLLPSAHERDKGFILRYHETLVLGAEAAKEGKGLFYLDSNVRRQITTYNLKNSRLSSEDYVGTLQRSVSFWSRRYDDTSWDSILLTDPPVGLYGLKEFRFSREFKKRPINGRHDIYIGRKGRNGRESSPRLYQGGYIDFKPWPSVLANMQDLRLAASNGPNRTSMYDDVLHYWRINSTSHAPVSNPTYPLDGAIFAKKIVLSHWMLLIEFVRRLIHVLDRSEYEFEDAGPKLYLWNRRWQVFMDQINVNMQQLGLDPSIARHESAEDISAVTKLSLWQSDEGERLDWTHIRTRLSAFITRAVEISALLSAEGTSKQAHISNKFQHDNVKLQKLNAELQKKIAVIQERQEREGKNVGRLTTLGAVFLPLGFLSGLFSMTGEFQPGREHFWIYWVIGIPLVVMLFVSAKLLPSIEEVARRMGIWRPREENEGEDDTKLRQNVKSIVDEKMVDGLDV